MSTPRLAQRCRQPEWMDHPELDRDAHRRALRGLARLNRVSGAAAAIWRRLRAALPEAERLSILDVACGSADVGLDLLRRARWAGVELELTGCDLSPVAIEAARERAAVAGLAARFVRTDVLSAALPGRFDVVMSSLFVHHLSDDAACRLLGSMRDAAAQLVLVDDLVRSRFGLLLATAAPRLLSRSPVVHVDARRSVRAAFTPQEMCDLAARARLERVEIRAHWPARFLLTAGGAA